MGGPFLRRDRLRALLDERIAAVERGDAAAVAAVDQAIASGFVEPRAIMVTDTSNFTGRTRASGIVAMLMQIRRLVRVAEPIVARHGGEWIKVEADDLYVAHRRADALCAIGRELLEAVQRQDEGCALGLAIGMGYGPMLLLEHDAYGDAMNAASKLGEDLGRPGELLVTEEFLRQLAPELAARFRPGDAAARGAKFPFYVWAG